MNSSTTKVLCAAEGGHVPYEGTLIGAKLLNPFDKVRQQHYFSQAEYPPTFGNVYSSEKLRGWPTFVLVNSHD